MAKKAKQLHYQQFLFIDFTQSIGGRREMNKIRELARFPAGGKREEI
jgi:hypothetical protein